MYLLQAHYCAKSMERKIKKERGQASRRARKKEKGIEGKLKVNIASTFKEREE